MAEKKKVARNKAVTHAQRHIGLVKNDPYLQPFEDAIRGRHEHALWKIDQLTEGGKKSLADIANGHDYYGLHKTSRGWVFREWAPNATAIYLVGDFNGWTESSRYAAKRIDRKSTRLNSSHANIS